MGAVRKPQKVAVDEKMLRRFTTFQAMDAELLRTMARHSEIGSYPSGRTLFRRGDNDNYMYFLLAGELEARAPDGRRMVIKAGTPRAAEPVANRYPRPVEVRTLKPSALLRVDRHLVDFSLQPPLPADNYEVTELETSGDGDWICRYLSNINTARIPPGNIQALLTNIREIRMARGEQVIVQNSNDEHYYIVKEGRCSVTRRTRSFGDVKLAELEAGNGFGEEALITRGRRNATVTMEDEGILMRLPARDFLQLMVRPVVDMQTWSEAEELVRNGGRFLDIREDRRGKRQLAGALALPMSMLRSRLHTLSRKHPWVVVCDRGNISPAASYLLTQQGIENYVLMGGVINIPANAKLASRPPAATSGMTTHGQLPSATATGSGSAAASVAKEVAAMKRHFPAEKRAIIRKQMEASGRDDDLTQNDYSFEYQLRSDDS